MSGQTMLTFVTRAREMPKKRKSEERRKDFQEIYRRFSQEKAQMQSSRCSQCGVPFCQIHCPLHNNIPDWLRMVAQDRMEEAYRLSSSTNIFPEICGRICPQDKLCEGSCVIEQSGHGTVTIGAVEQYITEHAWEKGWVKALRNKESALRDHSIGIIGAGPAGLSAAADLCRLGYKVEVYDAWDRPGGLLIYGIPNFKLDKNIVNRRIDWLREGGIIFHQSTSVGKDVSFEALRKRHDGIIIATGTYKARRLEETMDKGFKGIIPALEYLINSNRKGLGDRLDHPHLDAKGLDAKGLDAKGLDAKGLDVAVIGGGDTAMDCLRTAIRQGAKSVHCFYRRDRANMPGSAREVSNAEAEGVIFHWLSAPKGFKTEKNAVTHLEIQNMRLGGVDTSGRKKSIPVPESVDSHRVDMVLLAMGFEAEDLPQKFNTPELKTTGWGTVQISYPSMLSALKGVFAAGDIVRGASLVVWAIREGRDAAQGMHQFLHNDA